MADIGLSAKIKPLGAFPIIDSDDAKGASRSVATHSDLASIPSHLLAVGMVVFVRDERAFYALGDDLSTWTAVGGPDVDVQTDPVVYYVDSGDGDDDTGDGTSGAPFASLGRVVDAWDALPRMWNAPVVVYLSGATAHALTRGFVGRFKVSDQAFLAIVVIEDDVVIASGTTTAAAPSWDSSAGLGILPIGDDTEYRGYTLKLTSGPRAGCRRTIYGQRGNDAYVGRLHNEDNSGIASGTGYEIVRPGASIAVSSDYFVQSNDRTRVVLYNVDIAGTGTFSESEAYFEGCDLYAFGVCCSGHPLIYDDGTGSAFLGVPGTWDLFADAITEVAATEYEVRGWGLGEYDGGFVDNGDGTQTWDAPLYFKIAGGIVYSYYVLVSGAQRSIVGNAVGGNQVDLAAIDSLSQFDSIMVAGTDTGMQTPRVSLSSCDTVVIAHIDIATGNGLSLEYVGNFRLKALWPSHVVGGVAIKNVASFIRDGSASLTVTKSAGDAISAGGYAYVQLVGGALDIITGGSDGYGIRATELADVVIPSLTNVTGGLGAISVAKDRYALDRADGPISANGQRIVGSADAVDPTDLVTLQQAQDLANGATAITKLSASAISGSRVVRYVDADHVGIASADTLTHSASIAGVSSTSTASAESDITIVRSGEVEDSGWSWTPGAPVFLGLNGALTQTHSPSWAFSLIVGMAISATRIVVDLRDPITQG